MPQFEAIRLYIYGGTQILVEILELLKAKNLPYTYNVLS